MTYKTIFLLLSAWPLLAPAADAASTERQAVVAERGAAVMPFSLAATTHVFTPTADGGRQSVIVKNSGDTRQVGLIREHLKALRRQFGRGDFAAPERIHGAGMPGLQTLKAARRGEIAVRYREIKDGAELSYQTKKPRLVAALHDWFDAQLADHGGDAMAGHSHAAGMGAH